MYIRDLIKVGDLLSFEPGQIKGERQAYRILSIDGNMVKVTTPEGFRLLPLVFLQSCLNEDRLLISKPEDQ